MTCLNSKVSWNMRTLEKKEIFYMSLELAWRHSHKLTCLHPPLLSFTALLCSSDFFCKTNYISLIEIEVKPSYTFKSSMAYWQHLDIVRSLQALMKGTYNPINSQDTTEVNEEIMVKRLAPSLTYVRTWTWSPCLISTSFTCSAIMGLDVFEVSKTPMVKW
jgi:hypothetical protein